MNSKAIVFGGSLLGACIIHILLTACGGGGGGHAGNRDASAQSSSSTTCSTWNVGYYFYAADTGSTGISATTTLPAGWEPIGALPFSGDNNVSGNLVAVRQCSQ